MEMPKFIWYIIYISYLFYAVSIIQNYKSWMIFAYVDHLNFQNDEKAKVENAFGIRNMSKMTESKIDSWHIEAPTRFYVDDRLPHTDTLQRLCYCYTAYLLPFLWNMTP